MCMSLWVCIYVCRCVGIRESKPRYSWAVRRLLTRLPGNMRVGRIVAGVGGVRVGVEVGRIMVGQR